MRNPFRVAVLMTVLGCGAAYGVAGPVTYQDELDACRTSCGSVEYPDTICGANDVSKPKSTCTPCKFEAKTTKEARGSKGWAYIPGDPGKAVNCELQQ